jgi:hypothetical protein
MQYTYRSAAKNAARGLGWNHFRTIQHPTDKTWSAKQIHATGVDFSWSIGKSFVAWREVDVSDGGRPRPVLIVSCTLEELGEENVPEVFIIEPQTPSLFASNEPEPVRKDRTTEGPKVERERSSVESPTKLVWATADAMASASRAEIIAACVAKGVHPATASTQFSKWRKARG